MHLEQQKEFPDFDFKRKDDDWGKFDEEFRS